MATYIDGRGRIVRQRRAPRYAALAAAAAVAVAAARSVPTLDELKRHRMRRDGLWLAPPVQWHARLGVAAVARTGGALHVGAFTRWASLADVAAPIAGADDATLLLGVVAAVFVAHALVPGAARRHCAASRAALRAGRVWCLPLASVAHDDALHAAFNGAALSRAAPALAARLGGDRALFWAFVLLAGTAASLASVAARPRAAYETRGASGIVFAMLAHEAAQDPLAPSVLYGVVELPAATALVAALALDVLVRSAHGIDFAAHAGGALFGLAFYELRRRPPWR